MKRPAVFFDRDNTLIASDGYLGHPGKVVLVEGAANAIAKARQYGFKVVTFSNQSGVARGYFDEDAVRAVNQRMDELLQQANPSAIIGRHEFCPFHPDAVVEQYRQDSDLRKPKPGMLFQAAEAMNLDLSRSWVIGDAPRDIEAGKAAGCRAILFKDPSLPPSEAADVPSEAQPDFVVSSLKEAVELIAREMFKPKESSPAPAQPDATDRSAEALVASPAPAPDPTSEPTAEPAEPVAVDIPAEPIHAVAEAMPEPAPEPDPTPSPEPTPAPVASVREPAPAKKLITVKKAADSSRTEKLLEQILEELKRRHDDRPPDFSVSKLLAGIIQVLAAAALIIAFMYRMEWNTAIPALLFAIALQTLTIALLIMGRQR